MRQLGCSHCALRQTLDAMWRIHNGNILTSVLIVAFVLRGFTNLPNFKLPEPKYRELTGVRKMSSRFTQYILVAMVLGIVMGAFDFQFPSR